MPFVLAQALLLMVAAVCTLTFLDGAPLVIVVMTALAALCLLADGLLLVIMRRAERLACERWYAEEQLRELSRQAAANRDALERAASVSRARHRLRNRLIDVCDLVGRGEDAQALAELDDLELGIRGGRDE